VVLRDDDALAIGAGRDLDEDAARGAIRIWRGERVMIERVLDGGECGEILLAWVDVRRGRVDADVNVGCGGELAGALAWLARG
jgi:hypothetical protein